MVGIPDRMQPKSGVSEDSWSLMNNLRSADFSSQTRLLRPNLPAVAKATCLKALSPCPGKPFLFSSLHWDLGFPLLTQANMLVRLSGVAVSRG
jgi:hypothetical protein